VPVSDIWYKSDAFNAYRGTEWLPEPCQSCDRKEIDFGGCRCQAMMLAGNAGVADPVCSKAPDHAAVLNLLKEAQDASGAGQFIYRAIAGRPT